MWASMAPGDASTLKLGDAPREQPVTIAHHSIGIDWSPSIGPGGRHQLERLVVFNRNRWSPSHGAHTPRFQETYGKVGRPTSPTCFGVARRITSIASCAVPSRANYRFSFRLC